MSLVKELSLIKYCLMSVRVYMKRSTKKVECSQTRKSRSQINRGPFEASTVLLFITLTH